MKHIYYEGYTLRPPSWGSRPSRLREDKVRISSSQYHDGSLDVGELPDRPRPMGAPRRDQRARDQLSHQILGRDYPISCSERRRDGRKTVLENGVVRTVIPVKGRASKFINAGAGQE